ncbi:hypothetical protein ACFL1V_03000 [Pseudomonadota bacterium]
MKSTPIEQPFTSAVQPDRCDRLTKSRQDEASPMEISSLSILLRLIPLCWTSDALPPQDVYTGRGQTVLNRRRRIKLKTLAERRRLYYQQKAA